MIRTIRAYFLTRALREKLLLVLFIGIGAAWWLSSYSTRASRFWREQRVTTSRLTEQAQWLKNAQAIEDRERETAKGLDASKTLNGIQLAATVSRLASDAGLRNNTTASPTLSRSGQFAVHSVVFTVRNAGWDPLLKFYQEVQKRSPYIAVENFTLRSLPNNPEQLELSLKVASMEIVR